MSCYIIVACLVSDRPETETRPEIGKFRFALLSTVYQFIRPSIRTYQYTFVGYFELSKNLISQASTSPSTQHFLQNHLRNKSHLYITCKRANKVKMWFIPLV